MIDPIQIPRTKLGYLFTTGQNVTLWSQRWIFVSLTVLKQAWSLHILSLYKHWAVHCTQRCEFPLYFGTNCCNFTVLFLCSSTVNKKLMLNLDCGNMLLLVMYWNNTGWYSYSLFFLFLFFISVTVEYSCAELHMVLL